MAHVSFKETLVDLGISGQDRRLDRPTNLKTQAEIDAYLAPKPEPEPVLESVEPPKEERKTHVAPLAPLKPLVEKVIKKRITVSPAPAPLAPIVTAPAAPIEQLHETVVRTKLSEHDSRIIRNLEKDILRINDVLNEVRQSIGRITQLVSATQLTESKKNQTDTRKFEILAEAISNLSDQLANMPTREPGPVINFSIPEIKRAVQKVVERDENGFIKSIRENIVESILPEDDEDPAPRKRGKSK